MRTQAPVAEWSKATVCKTVQSLVQIQSGVPVKKYMLRFWTCSSIGRAPPCHGGGSEIKTRQVRHRYTIVLSKIAQSVERETVNFDVLGSSPGFGATNI